MLKVTMHMPRHPLDWWRIRRLYRVAFPDNERKPFGIIRRMHRQRRADVWCCMADGRFAGLAATINSESLILLDYLAVSPEMRGKGVGSAFLHLLLQRYDGLGLFVEIEAVADDPTGEKVRRRAFYQRCGLEPLNVTASVFGVPMELLGRGCRLTLGDYQAFYRDHYSPWAAEHITPIKVDE